MGRAIDSLDFVLSGVLRVVFYRSLHMVSVPFNVKDVEAYTLEQQAGEGRFGGETKLNQRNPLWSMHEWNNVKMGEGVFMDVRFFGLTHGAQTIILRKRWFTGNFAPRVVGRSLGVIDGRPEAPGVTT